MAIPWLIGAAVLGVGALLASSSSDDNSSNGNGGDDERRRREQAERERRERERQEERQSIRIALQKEGEMRGADFQNTLSGWVTAEYQSQKPFKAAILQSGKQYKRVVAEHFTDSHQLYLLNKETCENLKEFETWYDVELTMTEIFHDAVDEITDNQKELQLLQDYRHQLERIRQNLRG